jgi:hypothetical protein
VYDIPIEDYHSDCCVGPSISSSGLRTLLLECPAKFWATSPLNPNRFPEESTKALDIGRAAHCLALGEPEFAKYFIVSPYDDFRKGEARAWRDEQTRTVIRQDDFETIQIVAAVQKRSAQCMRAFEDGVAERSLIWHDDATGVWLKARPDWLPNDPAKRLIVEYKTAISIEPQRMSNDAFRYGYQMQAAMQVDAVKAVLGIEPMGVAHVCQEKDPPYLVELRLFTSEQLEDGRFMYRRALELFAACLKEKNWPGYTSEPTYFQTPYRHAMQIEELRNDSRFSKPLDRSKSYTITDYLTNG